MKNIRLKFTYTKKEIIDSYRFHLRKHYGILFYCIFSAGILLYGIGFSVSWGYSLFWLILDICAGIILFFNLYAYFIVPHIFYSGHPQYKYEYSIEFTSDNINFSTKEINSKIKWSMYNKFLENNDFFILYYGKDLYSIIPKRVFKNKKDTENFKNLISKNIH